MTRNSVISAMRAEEVSRGVVELATAERPILGEATFRHYRFPRRVELATAERTILVRSSKNGRTT